MKLKLTRSLAAPPDRVFAALTNPTILKQCLEDCEEMEKKGDDHYEVRLRVGIAGLKGTYTGKVRITDQDPPRSLTLSIEGKGAPGFIQGKARIQLSPNGSGTELQSEGEVTVGGVIAAVGSRLIEAAARKMLTGFFERLAQAVE